MSMKSNLWAQGVGNLFFQNADFTLLGDAGGLRGSAAAGNLYLSLHSAFPGRTGDQTVSELAYTGYARLASGRNSTNWPRTGQSWTNNAALTFGQRTDMGASVRALYVGAGTDASGAGKLAYFAPIGATSAALAFTALNTGNTLKIPGHSFAVNDPVALFAGLGVTLPTGPAEGDRVFIRTVSGDDVTLSATSGGAELDLTSNGAGFIAKLTGILIDLNITPQIPASSLLFREA